MKNRLWLFLVIPSVVPTELSAVAACFNIKAHISSCCGLCLCALNVHKVEHDVKPLRRIYAIPQLILVTRFLELHPAAEDAVDIGAVCKYKRNADGDDDEEHRQR